jgi:hypothetical protein
VLLDDRKSLVRARLEKGLLPRIDRVMHAGQLWIADVRGYYSTWGSLYAFLASAPDRLKAFQKAVDAIPEPPDPPEASRPEERDRHVARGLVARSIDFATALEKAYGPLPALDAAWRASIRATSPAWSEVIPACQRVGAELVCASYPDPRTTAYAVRTEPAPAEPFVVSFAWNASPPAKAGDVPQAEVYLAYEDREALRFLKIAFRTDGNVTLLAYADGVWQRRYTVNVKLEEPMLGHLTAGAWHDARVDVDATTVRVDVGGQRVFEAALPPGFDTLGGRVGLGALGAVVRYKGFETKPRSAGGDGKPAGGR